MKRRFPSRRVLGSFVMISTFLSKSKTFRHKRGYSTTNNELRKLPIIFIFNWDSKECIDQSFNLSFTRFHTDHFKCKQKDLFHCLSARDGCFSVVMTFCQISALINAFTTTEVEKQR